MLPPRVEVEGDETGMDMDEVETAQQVANMVTQHGREIEDTRGGKELGRKTSTSPSKSLTQKRRKMWLEVNENASWRSTCCMEKIEGNLFLCKKCRAFKGDEEMLFQHWVEEHNFAAKVT